MDDHLFGLIARLPPGKWDLLVSGADEFKKTWNDIVSQTRESTEPFRLRLREVFDPKLYEGATSWGKFCKQCGCCCGTLTHNPGIFDFLIENGRCKHYLTAEKKCACYANRPLPCRVDDLYDAVYVRVCSRPDYYAVQAASCLLLRTLAKVAP